MSGYFIDQSNVFSKDHICCHIFRHGLILIFLAMIILIIIIAICHNIVIIKKKQCVQKVKKVLKLLWDFVITVPLIAPMILTFSMRMYLVGAEQISVRCPCQVSESMCRTKEITASNVFCFVLASVTDMLWVRSPMNKTYSHVSFHVCLGSLWTQCFKKCFGYEIAKWCHSWFNEFQPIFPSVVGKQSPILVKLWQVHLSNCSIWIICHWKNKNKTMRYTP